MEILWKSAVLTGFRAIRPKLRRNCAFSQNFHTRKLGEISVIDAIDLAEQWVSKLYRIEGVIAVQTLLQSLELGVPDKYRAQNHSYL